MARTVEEKAEAIFSAGGHREKLLSIFVESLLFAQKYKPERCIVRFNGSHLRLLVGRLIVMTVEGHYVWLAVDPKAAIDWGGLASWSWDTAETRPNGALGRPYEKYTILAPLSRNGFYDPQNDRNGEWELIRHAHFSYLQRVVEKGHAPDHRSFKKHVPEVIKYVLEQANLLGNPDDASFYEAVRRSMQLSSEERRRRLAQAPRKPEQVKTERTEFRRNLDVIAEVLVRAAGICEKCNHPAPFLRAKDHTPYLEVHHRIRLVDGGDDTVENAVALCPNCHRQEHCG